jgi:hypothetical protein
MQRAKSQEAELSERPGWALRLLMKFFQLEAYFPQQASDVLGVAMELIAKQVKGSKSRRSLPPLLWLVIALLGLSVHGRLFASRSKIVE